MTVNDLDPFGQGIVRHHGKALFIAGALPGEQAEAAITDDKHNFAQAGVKRRMTGVALFLAPDSETLEAPVMKPPGIIQTGYA